ncbi:MAG TPA: hypothetical protein VHT27_08865 [Solirubrobacteraceae bacterium]|jgi:hypothetical protein|nr:hypothetical protein [Solirubrobacteraceae bacterium]
MAGTRRVTVGFKGGQVLALRLAERPLEGLYAALEKGGWHQLDAEDGPVRIDLGQVVYVGAEGGDPHVGFG